MQRWLCHILSVAVLLAALGWSMDGHAVVDDPHDPGTELIDHQGNDEGGELCDHHCHAGSHLIALPALPMSALFTRPCDTLAMGFLPPNSLERDSPYRPPIS